MSTTVTDADKFQMQQTLRQCLLAVGITSGDAVTIVNTFLSAGVKSLSDLEVISKKNVTQIFHSASLGGKQLVWQAIETACLSLSSSTSTSQTSTNSYSISSPLTSQSTSTSKTETETEKRPLSSHVSSATEPPKKKKQLVEKIAERPQHGYPLPRGTCVRIDVGKGNHVECIILSNVGTSYIVKLINGGERKKIEITKYFFSKNVELISLPVDFQAIAIRLKDTVGPLPPHGTWENGVLSATILAMFFADYGRANKRVGVVGYCVDCDEKRCNTCHENVKVSHLFVQTACAVGLRGCIDADGKPVKSQDPYWRVYCCTKKCIDPYTCPPLSKFKYVGTGTKEQASKIVKAAFSKK